MTAEPALGPTPSLLSAADVAHYQSEGFLALPAFLTETELAHWRAVTDAAVALRVEAADELSNAGADPYYTSVFTQASGLHRISGAMDDLVRGPRLGAMAAPKTHESARLDAVDIGPNLKGIIGHYPEWEAIDSQPVPVPAGGAIWHNGLIAHAAGANMTNRQRRIMTVAFIPDGAQYNGKRDEFVVTKGCADAMKVGDKLGDDTNPLVWPQGSSSDAPRRT